MTYDDIHQQTVAGPDSFNHWISLVLQVLQSSTRTSAKLVDGQWQWDAAHVQKVLKVAPRDLESVLEKREAR